VGQGPVTAMGVATAEIAENLYTEKEISAVEASRAATAPYGRTDCHLLPWEGGKSPVVMHKCPYAENKCTFSLMVRLLVPQGVPLAAVFTRPESVALFFNCSVLETSELTTTHKNFAALGVFILRVWTPLAEELARNACRL
jgi:hypothetical protein